MVRLRPARQATVSGMKGTHYKLTKFYGPFPIVEKIGLVAYRLKLPAGARSHPVFHCSLLIPFHGAPTSEAQLPLPETAIDNQPLVTPLTILDSRRVMDSLPSKWKVLVQWVGLSPDDASWEDWDQLHSDYHLKDKVFLQVTGNDSNLGVQ